MSNVWAQITGIANGTRIFNYGFDQCVALANHYHALLGGEFVPVASASQWWTGSYPQIDRIYTRSQDSAPGAIFVAAGAIYDRTHGHIGIVLDDDDQFIYTLEQNAGTWRYCGRYKRDMNGILGFLIPKNNPAAGGGSQAPEGAVMRQVGPNPVKRRADATTKSAEKQPPLTPGAEAFFTAWKNGEMINDGRVQTDRWFRGISGDWFWAGGFTFLTIDGMENLNTPAPPAVGVTQRQVDPVPVNVRASATSTAQLTSSLDANAIVTPEGWVRGQEVSGIAIWYKVAGGYAWAGGFTREDTAGLQDLNITPAPILPTPEPTDPTGPVSDMGSPGKVLGAIDLWSLAAPPYTDYRPLERFEPASVHLAMPGDIKIESREVTEGFYVGRPGKPNHFGMHHAASPHLEGVVNTLRTTGVTAQWVIKDKRAIRMVSSKDTASTNGRYRSNQFAINLEICNDKTTTDKPSNESHETAAWIVAEEALQWGMQLPLANLETLIGHNRLSKSSTSCPGQLDIDWIAKRANEIIAAHNAGVPNEEIPAPDYSGLEEKLGTLAKLVQKLIDLLGAIFKGGAK